MGRPRRRSGTSGADRRRWTGRAAARAAARHGAGPFHRRGLRPGRRRTGHVPCRQRPWAGGAGPGRRRCGGHRVSQRAPSTGRRARADQFRPAVPVLADGRRLGPHPRQLPAPPGPVARGSRPARRYRRGRGGRGARRAAGGGDRGDGVRRGRSGRRTAYPRGVGGARAGRRDRHTPAADARPDRGAGTRGCTPPSRRVGFAAAARHAASGFST